MGQRSRLPPSFSAHPPCQQGRLVPDSAYRVCEFMPCPLSDGRLLWTEDVVPEDANVGNGARPFRRTPGNNSLSMEIYDRPPHIDLLDPTCFSASAPRSGDGIASPQWFQTGLVAEAFRHEGHQ